MTKLAENPPAFPVEMVDGAYREIKGLYDIAESRLELAQAENALLRAQVARLSGRGEKVGGADLATGEPCPACKGSGKLSRHHVVFAGVPQATSEAMRERDEARAERDAMHARLEELTAARVPAPSEVEIGVLREQLEQTESVLSRLATTVGNLENIRRAQAEQLDAVRADRDFAQARLKTLVDLIHNLAPSRIPVTDHEPNKPGA